VALRIPAEIPLRFSANALGQQAGIWLRFALSKSSLRSDFRYLLTVAEMPHATLGGEQNE